MKDKCYVIRKEIQSHVKGNVLIGINMYSGFCDYVIETENIDFACTVPFYTIKNKNIDDIVKEILTRYAEYILTFYLV